MGKHSHTGLIGGAMPYVFLLGVLVLPSTVVSQQVDMNDDARFTAPVQQQNQYGANSFGDHMPYTGYPGSSYGQNPGYGMPPSQRYAGSGQGGGAGMPSMQPTSPMLGMGANTPSSPQQNRPSGYGTMGYGKPAPMPYGVPGRGCSKGKAMGCAHQKNFMRHHGGMGPGNRMGMGAGIGQLLQIPDLSGEQREKIQDIADELRRNHWKSMGEKMEHSAQLRRLWGAKPLDAKAIGETYAKVFDIKRKMIVTTIEARQKATDVLTDEQRKQLQ